MSAQPVNLPAAPGAPEQDSYIVSEGKKRGSTREVRPEAAYECADLPAVASAPGEIEGKARQIRDPGVFEEAGKTFLFYSICGEQGLAAAEVTLR